MNNRKSGGRTLLLSVLMSAPGPLILGLGLLEGHSSTQIADFVRRSAELLAIIMAYVTYLVTTRDSMADPNRRAQVERFSNLFVGAMMCLGGFLMLVLAFVADSEDKGNVIPALAIAVMGVIANTLFWRKYARLNRADPNPILAVQVRLYRAKSLVDGCVTLALLAVLLLPDSPASAWLDRIGSAVVAVYLVFCGMQTIRERLEK
jgi:divalent metal cation (Fe/Co/Zn/Cd) transporter